VLSLGNYNDLVRWNIRRLRGCPKFLWQLWERSLSLLLVLPAIEDDKACVQIKVVLYNSVY